MPTANGPVGRGKTNVGRVSVDADAGASSFGSEACADAPLTMVRAAAPASSSEVRHRARIPSMMSPPGNHDSDDVPQSRASLVMAAIHDFRHSRHRPRSEVAAAAERHPQRPRQTAERGQHEPLISYELVRRRAAVFNAGNRPTYTKHQHAFAGVLTCGHIYYHCTITNKSGSSLFQPRGPILDAAPPSAPPS